MDVLDNVFVPYRDLLMPIPKSTAPSVSKWRWIWLVAVLVLAAMAVGVWAKRQHVTLGSITKATELWSPAPAVSKALVAPVLPVAALPTLASIPQTISLIRGGSQSSMPAQTPQELAKQVGLAVRDTLLTFPQLSAMTVASIVQTTVKTILGQGTQERVSKVEEVPRALAQKVEETPKARAPTGGVLDLRGKLFPVVEEDIVQEEAGSKQKKINADSDPAVLKMMKERGLDAKAI